VISGGSSVFGKGGGKLGVCSLIGRFPSMTFQGVIRARLSSAAMFACSDLQGVAYQIIWFLDNL
jgi:hypothetical protein